MGARGVSGVIGVVVRSMVKYYQNPGTVMTVLGTMVPWYLTRTYHGTYIWQTNTCTTGSSKKVLYLGAPPQYTVWPWLPKHQLPHLGVDALEERPSALLARGRDGRELCGLQGRLVARREAA